MIFWRSSVFNFQIFQTFLMFLTFLFSKWRSTKTEQTELPLQSSAGRQKLRYFTERWALSCQLTAAGRDSGVNKNHKFPVKTWYDFLKFWSNDVCKKMIETYQFETNTINMISSKMPLWFKVDGEFITLVRGVITTQEDNQGSCLGWFLRL